MINRWLASKTLCPIDNSKYQNSNQIKIEENQVIHPKFPCMKPKNKYLKRIRRYNNLVLSTQVNNTVTPQILSTAISDSKITKIENETQTYKNFSVTKYLTTTKGIKMSYISSSTPSIQVNQSNNDTYTKKNNVFSTSMDKIINEHSKYSSSLNQSKYYGH